MYVNNSIDMTIAKYCKFYFIHFCGCDFLQIYAKTKDDHFELVVVDYDSEEGIIEEKLRDSSINRSERD